MQYIIYSSATQTGGSVKSPAPFEGQEKGESGRTSIRTALLQKNGGGNFMSAILCPAGCAKVWGALQVAGKALHGWK